MTPHIPTTQVKLMMEVYRNIFPAVRNELDYWENRAKQIPNKELRSQALASIHSKRFHCQGGAVFALLAGEKWTEAIRFIVAYQTISDYLDNLCDRSTSLDPNDFRLLHEAMNDALIPNNNCKNYYALRKEQADDHYLEDLVQTCQQVLAEMDAYSLIQTYILHLQSLYADLQVHKHVAVDQRVPRLTTWYKENKASATGLAWFEFSASAGSTLGIFCLASYAIGGSMSKELAQHIFNGYFPYVQGLHILLDYYIDQNEDIIEGDLNFCSFYSDNLEMKRRFLYFIECGKEQVMSLPHPKFHEMIIHGLVGLYLGDAKVKKMKGGEEMAKQLLKITGGNAKFFHWNTKMYYRWAKGEQTK